MISSQERSLLRKNVEKYEGRVSHMYLDSRGYVTVGVGHLLATLEGAQSLPFFNADSTPASRQKIADDYKALKAQPSNKLASFYKTFTSIHLTDEVIDQLTDKHIDSFYQELKVIYADFDEFPQEVKLATFDLIFNLGMSKLKNQWPKFNGCIARHDWQGASAECRRRGGSDSRNHYVRDLLIKAANTSTVS